MRARRAYDVADSRRTVKSWLVSATILPSASRPVVVPVFSLPSFDTNE